MSSAFPELVLPRVALADGPTPLELLERLSAAVGCEIWIKRDDVGSVGLAGNKRRKLEAILASPTGVTADTLVTGGAAQSNSARAVAAAAARTGKNAVLVLTGKPQPAAANLLLAELFGAQIVWAGGSTWGELTRQLDVVAAEVAARGEAPLILPIGCSSVPGAASFVLAYAELVGQLDDAGVDAEAVVVASSSGGTLAGLAAGRAALGRGPAPYGFGVAPGLYDDMDETYGGLARSALALLEIDAAVLPTHVALDWSAVGDGYAIPTAAALEAIRLLARSEAILCDPVYSGKALAGLITLARAGHWQRPVVFWHTGGYHAVFAPTFGDQLVQSNGQEG